MRPFLEAAGIDLIPASTTEMITAADVVDPRRDTADPMVRMQFLGGMYTVFTGAAAAIAELGDGASVADVVTHLLPDADRTAIDAVNVVLGHRARRGHHRPLRRRVLRGGGGQRRRIGRGGRARRHAAVRWLPATGRHARRRPVDHDRRRRHRHRQRRRWRHGHHRRRVEPPRHARPGHRPARSAQGGIHPVRPSAHRREAGGHRRARLGRLREGRAGVRRAAVARRRAAPPRRRRCGRTRVGDDRRPQHLVRPAGRRGPRRWRARTRARRPVGRGARREPRRGARADRRSPDRRPPSGPSPRGRTTRARWAATPARPASTRARNACPTRWRRPHGRVLFAGEATARTGASTVDGAWLTGIREAKRLLGVPAVDL